MSPHAAMIIGGILGLLVIFVVMLTIEHNAAVADFGRRIRALERQLEKMTGKEFS